MDPEELRKTVAEYNMGNKKPNGTIEKVDKNTTVEYRDIEGGHEEIYTTIREDGTRSIKKKTFYDAKIASDNDNVETKNSINKSTPSNKKMENTALALATDKRKVLKKTDSQESYKNYQHKQEKTVEEHRKVTQTSQFSGKTTVTRKGSIQEQSINSMITSHQTNSEKKDTKKKKPKNAPAPPTDFVENDSTTIEARQVAGGYEYVYSTTLEDGRTITTTKTVYEEEEVDMTDADIQAYKKQLKDAEKYKNITKSKTIKSESGTKKIVPSENPDDVTTVETIRIDGGTEFHYTSISSEGIVKKSVKTVYDAVSVEGDEEEQEIVEEYEEEIIEPGETITTVTESTRSIEKRYDAETIVTKKEKKVSQK